MQNSSSLWSSQLEVVAVPGELVFGPQAFPFVPTFNAILHFKSLMHMSVDFPLHPGTSRTSYQKSPWPRSAHTSKTVHSQKNGTWKRPAQALEVDPEHLGHNTRVLGSRNKVEKWGCGLWVGTSLWLRGLATEQGLLKAEP